MFYFPLYFNTNLLLKGNSISSDSIDYVCGDTWTSYQNNNLQIQNMLNFPYITLSAGSQEAVVLFFY